MPTDPPSPLTIIALEAELQFKTQSSRVYELYQQHNANELSLMGWVDIHYPCDGDHQLRVRACLAPSLTQFESSTNFAGDPSDETNALIQHLLSDARAIVGAPDDCTWHVDLQNRDIGTFDCRPWPYL